jgi:hypothetical protein
MKKNLHFDAPENAGEVIKEFAPPIVAEKVEPKAAQNNSGLWTAIIIFLVVIAAIMIYNTFKSNENDNIS